MPTTQPSSKFLRHTACDACGSSDANSLYDDGHTYCFNCETFIDGTASDGHRPSQPVQGARKPLEIPRLVPVPTKPVEAHLSSLLGITDRGITADTCRFVGIKGDDAKHY